MSSLSRAIALSLFVCVAAATAVFADRLKLKDGTVLDGTVIPRADGYWVKTADGATRIVGQADVVSFEKGTAAAPPAGAPSAKPPGTPVAPAAPGAVGTPAAPGPALVTPAGPRAPLLTFGATRAKAALVDNALAAVTVWQQFVDNNPTSPDLPVAKQELEKWKALAASGAEKIKGKWVGGDERQAILDKAVGLFKEADELFKANQTLQAMKKFEEAAGVYPNSFEVNFQLGYLYMLQHNDDKAIQWFNEALRVRPESPEAMTNVGVIMVSKKQYEKGIAQIRKALNIQDRKDIVQNLITAIAAAPPNMQKSRDVKEALEAGRLLASKYDIAGPAKDYYIVPLAPKAAKAGGDKDKAAPGMWSGTGFLVSDDGLILTNRHVVDGGKTLMVILSDRTQKAAEVVVIDDEQDLALVRIKADAGKKLPFVKLAPLDAPADGAECTVMGFPLIDRLGATIKITRGIVSSGAAGGKKLTGPDVVIDAKVNPGNSGGPILDKHGNVMAIVSMKTIGSASEDTYGLGISAGHIRTFMTKNKLTLPVAKGDGAALSAEEIAANVKPAAVCILATK